jgi:hypothetical protein
MDTKDRLGAMLEQKERAEENRYFAERDRELIAHLKHQQEAEQEKTLREFDRSRCPRCGERLRGRSLHEVPIDECPACQGVWLDKGELEAVSQHQGREWTRQFLEGLSQLLMRPAR